ncbi:hypothetical protein AeRB84_013675, partial [Aphanomyces euteiches]
RRQPGPVDEDWSYDRKKTRPPPGQEDEEAADEEHEVEDDDMGYADGFMQNAPALPKPPRFKGSTKAERRRFMDEYNLYISQTNALTANGIRPFIMPVAACIEPESKHRIALWGFVKNADDVTEAEWISFAQAHVPETLQALIDMEPPKPGAELQQFLCATNWMRSNIPQYSELVSPLTKLLDIAAKAAHWRKKTALKRVLLSSVGWCDDHVQVFDQVKSTLVKMVPLAHPDPAKMVCLYTDANDLSNPVSTQRHEPLAFLSGSFKGASERWPIVKKEAFAVVESCKRLEYLLVRDGFRLFTDHRNLEYMFNPFGTSAAMAKYQAHKLQRLALTMSTFPYLVECVVGEENVWADLLSRWRRTDVRDRAAHMRRLALVSPLQSPSFEWLCMEEIVSTQRKHLERDVSSKLSNERRCCVTPNGRVWIPDDAVDLQVRICVIAHAGIAGHQRVEATTTSVLDFCEWKTLRDDVRSFVHALGERLSMPLALMNSFISTG